jgi:hypothetical protein
VLALQTITTPNASNSPTQTNKPKASRFMSDKIEEFENETKPLSPGS